MSKDIDVKRLSWLYSGALVHLSAIYNYHGNRLLSEEKRP